MDYIASKIIVYFKMCTRLIICLLILFLIASVDSESLDASMQISVIKSTICSCSYKSSIILSSAHRQNSNKITASLTPSTTPLESLLVYSGSEVSYEEPLRKTTITSVIEVNQNNGNTSVADTSVTSGPSDQTFITKTQKLSPGGNEHSVVASGATELYANEFKREGIISNIFVFTATPSHASFSAFTSTSISSASLNPLKITNVHASDTGTPPLSVTPTSISFSSEVQSLKKERDEVVPSSLRNDTVEKAKTIFDGYKDKEVLKTSLTEASVSRFTDKRNGESEWPDQRFKDENEKGVEQEEEVEQQQQKMREKEIMNNIMLGLGCGLTACIMLITTCICFWKYCCASVFPTSPTSCLNKVHPMLMHVIPPKTRKITSGFVGRNSRYKKYGRRGRLTTFRMFQDV